MQEISIDSRWDGGTGAGKDYNVRPLPLFGKQSTEDGLSEACRTRKHQPGRRASQPEVMAYTDLGSPRAWHA